MTATPRAVEADSAARALFAPLAIGELHLRNRVVMAPMTRAFAANGVPHDGFVDYYRRRAEGGVGLIVTQGTWVPHPDASDNADVPDFFGQAALAGWRTVVEAVHAAGARIIPQLWHIGAFVRPSEPAQLRGRPWGPSGTLGDGTVVAQPMRQSDIDAVIDAFVQAALSAKELGFDGIELHGAHGYLFDQFFWERTNTRTDRYGGDHVARTRFAVEVIEEIKRRTGASFPLVLRFSQWKQHDYDAQLVSDPAELEGWLAPLVEAGVDVFHCSSRRFWEPEFAGSPLNLAGWTKKLSGRPTITVGSIGLDLEFLDREGVAQLAGLDALLERLEAGEFDLVAVGRQLIANPGWAAAVRRGDLASIVPFDRSQLKTLD